MFMSMQLIGTIGKKIESRPFGRVLLPAVLRAASHSPWAYEPAATVGAASVGHERTKGESRGQITRGVRHVAGIVAFAGQSTGD